MRSLLRAATTAGTIRTRHATARNPHTAAAVAAAAATSTVRSMSPSQITAAAETRESNGFARERFPREHQHCVNLYYAGE